MQGSCPPRSPSKLQKATIVIAVTLILSTLAYVYAAVAFTPKDTFAAPLLDNPTNLTTTSEPEGAQLSDATYTVLLIVCFTAVLVAVSLMIAAVELNRWRYKKITL